MKLALLGHGHVARALEKILRQKQSEHPFTIVGIHTRSHPAADSVERFLDLSRANVLVELTTLNPLRGEPAISHIRAAFARGMHVVTANKGPIAHAYAELQEEAGRCGSIFRFESAVMDGAPVFNMVRNSLPGVTILGFTGVLNSTTKLVVEAMENGRSFEDGLANARRLGVTEADASHDLEGWDSAVKTAALANVWMDARVAPKDVSTSGIMQFTPQMVQALKQAGKTVRLVSRAHRNSLGLHLHVGPEILQREDPLACARGTSNLILLHTDFMGTLGTVSINPGVEQSAYGVYIDLLDVLRETTHKAK